MTPFQIVAILAMTAYAIYKQTVVSEVTASGRFKMAVIYGVIGLALGGFDLPSGFWGIAMLVFSLALSAVVGLGRGRWTDIWVASDGRVMRKGNALTIGLFVGLVAVKFGLGTLAYFTKIDDGAGFGEGLVMIAIMVAFQAQIVWKRGERLGARTTAAPAPAVSDTPTAR